jgi:hypothetical protein
MIVVKLDILQNDLLTFRLNLSVFVKVNDNQQRVRRWCGIDPVKAKITAVNITNLPIRRIISCSEQWFSGENNFEKVTKNDCNTLCFIQI